MKNNVQLISPELFAEPGVNTYAILDGASVPDLVGKLHECGPKHECLYRGELTPDIAEVAPYLVQLEAETEFTDWVLNRGWGNHWGVFAVSAADLFAMRQHFRKFLTVYDTSGKPMLFRYYDPRVLSVYLPTCNPEEVTSLFGPVSRLLMESEGVGAILMFENNSGTLLQKKKLLGRE
jgi:hypothetical protein